jgi:hypothetical protein
VSDRYCVQLRSTFPDILVGGARNGPSAQSGPCRIHKGSCKHLVYLSLRLALTRRRRLDNFMWVNPIDVSAQCSAHSVHYSPDKGQEGDQVELVVPLI